MMSDDVGSGVRCRGFAAFETVLRIDVLLSRVRSILNSVPYALSVFYKTYLVPCAFAVTRPDCNACLVFITLPNAVFIVARPSYN